MKKNKKVALSVAIVVAYAAIFLTMMVAVGSGPHNRDFWDGYLFAFVVLGGSVGLGLVVAQVLEMKK